MNFKVRCINDSGSCHTIGKIYEIKDGIMETDRCDTMQMWGYKPFKSVKDINSQLNSQFELVEEESKYKVGDRVLIRSDLEVGKEYGDVGVKCLFPTWLDGTQGKIATITKTEDFGGGDRYVTDLGSYYCNEMIERKVEGMRKEDLKTGMFVTTRNGRGFRLLLGTENGDYGWNQSTGAYIKLKCYNDDLTDKNNREWDIVRVDSIKYPENMKRKLLWERPAEIKELTLKEIADKFGVPVESLRVKE
jgi:hypothetical protein